LSASRNSLTRECACAARRARGARGRHLPFELGIDEAKDLLDIASVDALKGQAQVSTSSSDMRPQALRSSA
jgi:hypothetical protein